MAKLKDVAPTSTKIEANHQSIFEIPVTVSDRVSMLQIKQTKDMKKGTVSITTKITTNMLSYNDLENKMLSDRIGSELNKVFIDTMAWKKNWNDNNGESDQDSIKFPEGEGDE